MRFYQSYKYFMTALWLFFSVTTAICNTSAVQFRSIDREKGLSNNQVNCCFKDSQGFMWIGTMSGLNRYDGTDIKIYEHNPQDSLSLNDNFVLKIIEDKDGILWVLSRNSSLCFYDPKAESFTRDYKALTQNISIPRNSISDIFTDRDKNVWVTNEFFGVYVYNAASDSTVWLSHSPSDPHSILSDQVSSIAQSSTGDYWLINKHGILERLDQHSLKVVERTAVFEGLIEDSGENFRIFIDKDDDIWVYLESNSLGVTWYNPKSKEQIVYNSGGSNRINNNTIKGIVQDSQDRIWIGTDHGGINLVDKQTRAISSVTHAKGIANALPDNSITTLYADDSGIVWVGMYKNGLAYYHPDFFKFNLVRNNPFDINSLPFDDINCFSEDENGDLWLGTNGNGLVHYNKNTGLFKSYQHNPNNPTSISSDIIISMLYDSQKRLWIGTYFGGLNLYDNGKFHHFKHDIRKSTSLSNDRVWQIFEDSDSNIWIGTLGGGIDLFYPDIKTFVNYKSSDINSVHSDYIFSIEEDHQGNIWIGTVNGVDYLDKKTKRFYRYINHREHPNSLSDNKVLVVKTDNRGWCWIGTSNGLNLFNPEQNNFRVFTKQNGLPDNSILSIEVDGLGNLWISTPKGLSKMTVADVNSLSDFRYSFLNFNKSDGLNNTQFNERSSLTSKNGQLFFGGSNGYISFDPDEIKDLSEEKPVVLTKFELFNQDIQANKSVNNRIIIRESILFAKQINLKHDENIFSIGFIALDFFHPERLKYQYKLEGFTDEWYSVSPNSHKVTFTNLNPGEYTFRVRVSKDEANWTENETKLVINILPPFWATNWAKALYVIVIAFVLIALRKAIIVKERTKNQIENAKQEAIRRQEIDQMKIKFFTNVSHEFRTPLTLILSPVEKLIADVKDQALLLQLKMIERNGKRLLQLVNQLLDFRKMEVNQLTLNLNFGNIIQFIKDTSDSFKDISETKGISLTFNSNIANYNTWFDHDKLEKIIFNLLSNALKFSLEHGQINVSATILLHPDASYPNDGKLLRLEVADTGIGISPAILDKVFDRFFQEEDTAAVIQQGSGIGLSLCKEFVALHGGEIFVKSKLNEGSIFTVEIPLRSQQIKEEAAFDNESHSNDTEVLHSDGAVAQTKNKKRILLVEDNEDLRFYLKENLSAKYEIAEASNGKNAWEYAQKHSPDLIVSDIMMPVMDGLELLKKIKNEVQTSHIPIILLTARHSRVQESEGLEIGADEYITKPFSYEILALKIKNLIKSREAIQQKIGKTLEIKPSEIGVTSLDEKIFHKAIDVVEKNIGNANFNVEQLGQELGMSRAHLYNKFIAITGKTPAEFIKIMRLKRAAQLMEKSQLSVSEISFEVGYNGPRYFSAHFKDHFEMSPSEYIKLHNPKN
ncbi:two-component regulator propeller domain-containing protein [Mangrovibacterium sp.]|uniref:hybrid sensor histidine kinase/response regulator transcription factor n=1 Tax=Mangrovibacterium sp. TaxID=1961364 RepID=UPI003569A95D